MSSRSNEKQELKRKLREKIHQKQAIRTGQLSQLAHKEDDPRAKEIQDLLQIKSMKNKKKFLKKLLSTLSGTEHKQLLNTAQQLLGNNPEILKLFQPNKEQKKKSQQESAPGPHETAGRKIMEECIPCIPQEKSINGTRKIMDECIQNPTE